MTQSIVRVNHLAEVENREPTFLAIGSFDGVHRGHQLLLQQMVAAARQNDARAAVLTFFPHPKRVLQDMSERYYINTLDDRVELLGQQGVDLVIVHPFNEEVRQTRASDFVDQLCRHLDMRQLWGGNFALGYQREGDVPFLRRLGAEKGYSVKLVPDMVEFAGRLVSSSRVRESLAMGAVTDVHGCLGRPFHVRGIVVKGDQRGRTIGFPTANMEEWEEMVLPDNGVYATYAWLEGQRYGAATNVGIRPTVNGRGVRVEAHLLDFDREIYGAELKVEFIARIRPEMKFSGLDALQAQIKTDVAKIRRLLA